MYLKLLDNGVFATHDPVIAETDPEKAIAAAKKDVLLSLGGVVAGSINTNPIEQKVEIPVDPEISPAQTIITKSPKVQLNLLDFVPVIRNLRALKRAKKAKALEPDIYFVPKGELVLELRDSTDSLIFEKREKLTISSAVSWEKLMSNLEIKEDGNLKVYIDNSSSDKVYFDNFEIERTEATVAVVVQENHYYPFGMNMKGIEELDLQSLGNTDEHRFQYNGKEKEESFGLNWTDYGWRNYDPQLSRWHGVDNLAEKYQSISPYVYVANNPIILIDPDGRQIGWYVDKTTGEGYHDGVEDGKVYTFEGTDENVKNAKDKNFDELKKNSKQVLDCTGNCNDKNSETITRQITLADGATQADLEDYINAVARKVGFSSDTPIQANKSTDPSSNLLAVVTFESKKDNATKLRTFTKVNPYLEYEPRLSATMAVLSDYNATKNTLVHEKKHYDEAKKEDYRKPMADIYFLRSVRNPSEQRAIHTQKSHSSYEATPSWYKKMVNDYQNRTKN